MTSPQNLYQNAYDLIPDLLAQGEETDQARQLSDHLVQELIQARFFDIVAPKSQGGLEYDLDVLLEVAKILGQGCGSTAWITSLLGTHNWLGGLFSEQAQAEIFANKGHVLAPAIFAPSGKAQKVEGGFTISGEWQFASGIQHSDWIMLSALSEDNEKIIGMECVVVPIHEVEVLDTWHTVGMRGTGSHNIRLDNVYVPKHRSVALADILNGSGEVAQKATNPMYRIPLVPYLSYTAAAPALGIGLGAYTQFKQYMQERIMLGGEQQQEKIASQIRLGQAKVALKSAEQLMHQGVQDLMQKAKSGHPFSLEERVNYRAEACYIATIVKQVVDSLVEAAGARAQFENMPLQRFQRDINTLRGHIVFDMDSTMEMLGRVELGLAPNQALI